MNKIFLGKFSHWLLVITLIGLGWYFGASKAHVIHFNTFIGCTIVATMLAVWFVLKTTAPNEQVTREVIELDE